MVWVHLQAAGGTLVRYRLGHPCSFAGLLSRIIFSESFVNGDGIQLIQWCYQFTHKRIPIGHVFLSIIFLHRSRKCSLNASGDKKALDYPPNHYQQRILPVIIQKGPLAENKLPGESHTWDSRIAHHRPIQIFTRPAWSISHQRMSHIISRTLHSPNFAYNCIV